ncbi:MAG TPA: glycoside hydrolase family 35 protein [Pyrinomonadaceae bacterium]
MKPRLKIKIVLWTALVWLTLAAAVSPVQTGAARRKPAHRFGWQGEHFMLDGKPFQIIAGDMHYARVPRQYWRDRMRKMKAMGLNTLTTYSFWNLHEPKPGRFDFTGNLDIAAYIRIAQEEGLWVIVRPGPYICSEWEFGGFPAWLLSTPDMKVRSADPRFLKAAANYMKQVGRELAPLQITRGGPIIMVQVENEYGSFGSDKVYLSAVQRMIVDAGFDVTLFTSDGDPNKLPAGTLPGVLSVINFGAGDSPEKKFAVFDKFRQHVPRMCGEFWVGWFDSWGERHHTVAAQKAADGLDWMLQRGISVSIYMFHGGSSFAFMNGANDSKAYRPIINSYDYDAPLDEAGRPTEKYFALRDVIKRHLPAGTTLPELPAPLPMIELPRIELNESAALLSALGPAVRSERPQPMEALGQDYGFILYRKRVERAARGSLEIQEARDYALIYQGERRLGVLDRRLKQSSLDVELSASAPLDILVENMGRTNFGLNMVNDRKGITGQVALDGQELTGWEMYRLPLTDISGLKFSTGPKRGAAFYRGAFKLTATGDTYLDMRGWGKGLVWINGHNLGRYWRIGPQQSLFVPSGWLRKGQNEIIVLDLEEGRSRSVQGIKELVFETPASE